MIKRFIIIIIPILILSWGCGQRGNTIPGQIKPGSPEYIMNEGIFYLNEGRVDLAEKKLLQALKKKPNMDRALNSLGIIYMYKRDFDKAIQYFNKVLALNPQFIDAYNSLGLIHAEQGKYDLAKENFLVAANAEHYHTPENALVNLAMLELKFNHPDAARRYVEKGFEQNKSFAPLYNLMGFLLENEQKYEEALENYRKAHSLLTEPDVGILVNLGRIHIKMGNKANALDTLEKALGQSTNPTVREQILKMIKSLQEK
jgi:Tfp pilus assembly protein PilF